MKKTCPTCQVSYEEEIKFCPEDGTVLVAAGAPAGQVDKYIGRTVAGRWRIQEKLGEGGMGAVYRAHEAARNRMVAIKVLHEDMRHDTLLVKRFEREAKAVALLRHPHVVELYHSGVLEEGTPFMVMEFVRGQSLFELINKEKRLDERRAVHIMIQACAGIAEAHRQGIIHRDLKPENILICNKDGDPLFVKVLDFGIAKIADDETGGGTQLTRAGTVFGTPEYLSPEQAAAEPLDARSDVYALGVILYEMLVGNVPFTSHTAMRVLLMHLNETPRPPLDVVPGACSPAVQAVILKAMSKKREQRQQSVEALEEELRAAISGGKPVSRPAPVRPAASGTGASPRVATGAAAGAGGGGAVAAGGGGAAAAAPAAAGAPAPARPKTPVPLAGGAAAPAAAAPGATPAGGAPLVATPPASGGMSTGAWIAIIVLLAILALAGGGAAAYFLL